MLTPVHRRRMPSRLAALLFFTVAACAASPGVGPSEPLSACELFPADNVWNARVDGLPVLAQSGAYVASIGATNPVRADFGSGLWEGAPIGIPYTTVGAAQPDVNVAFQYSDESDAGPYPIPATAPVEGAPPGGTTAGGDRHVLVINTSDCTLYELYAAELQPNGTWQAGSGAVFDLSSNDLRPAGWTSADAAGLPILPGLVRYDEVAAGAIEHAIRFTASRTRKAYVWPARHHASSLTGAEYPAMGQRFRLRADFDASGMSPEVAVIVTAMKRYGVILADNGSPWFLSGVPDERWDNGSLRELMQITGADFEAVDVSGLMADPDSGRVVTE